MFVVYQIMSHSVPLIYRLYLHYGLYPITFNYARVPFNKPPGPCPYTYYTVYNSLHPFHMPSLYTTF